MTVARDLIPRDRTDFERLDQLLKLDPAEVDPCLDGLVAWLQDMNYPVARPIAEYLLGRGAVVVPHVKEVLRGNDRWWQYCLFCCLLDRWPRDLVEQIQPELERLAHIGIMDADEVDIKALRLLVQHGLGDRGEWEKLLRQKISGMRALLDELLEVERLLGS